MIAHVAQAGEQRGRVVLQLTSGHPNRHAIEAAMRVAQAFQSEIESLFVEDAQVFEAARFPFAREVSLSGRRQAPLSHEIVTRQMRFVAAALQRQIGQLARRAEVPLRTTVVRDEAVAAVARACAACGPWNVVALADPLSGTSADTIRRLFSAVTGTTGVIAVGPAARRASGPVIAAVEDIGHLEPMLRAAERLNSVPPGESITLLLIGHSTGETEEMEGQARLVLGAGTDVTLQRAEARHGQPGEIADTLRRARGSFVVARFGGLLVPAEGDLRHLTHALECPLFLMR